MFHKHFKSLANETHVKTYRYMILDEQMHFSEQYG